MKLSTTIGWTNHRAILGMVGLWVASMSMSSSSSSPSFVRGEKVEDMNLVTGPVDIVIGDDPDQFSIGWSDGVCYLPIEKARVGDKLVFNFFQHNVYKMPSLEAMENCDFSQATLLSARSPYEYTITRQDLENNKLEDGKNASLYFACEVSSHCFGEQRLQVQLDTTTTDPDVLQNGVRFVDALPASRFVLGASSSSCKLVRDGLLPPDAASRVSESECGEPELRGPTEDIDRPHYFRSCLGPPITLTPGGVINQASVLSFPFPTDRRVLVGTRMWEFVQGDLDNLQPVELKQLYIHHIAGSVVLGNGAENIRQSEEDGAFPLPYGMLTGDFDDRMIFHLIDLRETGDKWLECLECRCRDGQGTYLGFGSSETDVVTDDSDQEGNGPEGGVSCCTNCTDLTGPTIDYRLRYNVTYTELTDIDVPIVPLRMITADVAPAIDRYVEWDVPQYENLPDEHKLEGNPKVQVIERVGTLRDLFGGFFTGARYTGDDLMEIHRCIGHLHVAGLGMWLYDDQTGDLICHNDVEYGTDPAADKGFLRSISVTNYDPPLEILSDRKVRLVTHYDAEILHTGVMGLIFLMVADKKHEVTANESSLTAEICSSPVCDVRSVLPNGGCRDSLEDSILCSFTGLCECSDLLALKDTVGGCNGVYMSSFGNVTVGNVCAETCGCGEDLLEDSIVEQIEEETKKVCAYGGVNCTRYLANVYACAQPWAEGTDDFNDAVMAIVAKRGKRLALQGTQLGDSSMHRFNKVKLEDVDISPCDIEKYPPLIAEEEKEANAMDSGTDEKKKGGFHPLHLFPVVAVGLIAILGLYSWKVRSNRQQQQQKEIGGGVELDQDEEIL